VEFLFSVDLFFQYIPLNYWKSNFTASMFTRSVSFVSDEAKTPVKCTSFCFASLRKANLKNIACPAFHPVYRKI
jgi:hypothetical protein